MEEPYAKRRAELRDELNAIFRAAHQAGAKKPRDLTPWIEKLNRVRHRLDVLDEEVES